MQKSVGMAVFCDRVDHRTVFVRDLSVFLWYHLEKYVRKMNDRGERCKRFGNFLKI